MNELATTGLTNFIERASRDDSFSLEKFRELILMQREAEQSFARHEFNVAMSSVQSEMVTIGRDRSNPSTRSNYATLQAIDAVARPVYTRHGFSIRFGTGPAPEGWVRVTCELAHVGGYSESHYLDGPLDNSGAQGRTNKTGIQAIGSTVSYLRRYLLLLVLNLVTADDDDDDGDDGEATRRTAAARTPPPERRVAPKVYDAEPDPLDEPDGRKWLLNLEMGLANAQSQQEVVDISDHSSVKHVISDPAAPADVKRRVTYSLAKAFGRFHDPDTGEIHVPGEEKMASG